MPERWLTELGKIDRMGPSLDLLERAEGGPFLPEPRSRPAARVTAAIVALLVAVAGGWVAFDALRGTDGVDKRPAGDPDAFSALWPETSLADAHQIQAHVDAGDPEVQWRTDAGGVALQYAKEVLGWPDPIAGATTTDDPDSVIVSLHGPDASCEGAECQEPQPPQSMVNVTLQRLVRAGEGGIWSITAVNGEGDLNP
jgi:hypothetical protein